MKARLALLVLFVCSCSSSKSGQSNLDAGTTVAAGDDSAAVAADTRLPDDVLAKDTLGPSPTSDANGTPGPEAGKADASTGKDAPVADTSLPADTRGPDASGVETGATGLTFSIDINKGPTRQYLPPSAPTAVSPYVYGINGFGKFVATKTQWGLIRQGGDGFTAYNWTEVHERVRRHHSRRAGQGRGIPDHNSHFGFRGRQVRSQHGLESER